MAELYESIVHWWPLAAIVILGIDGLGGGGKGKHAREDRYLGR